MDSTGFTTKTAKEGVEMFANEKAVRRFVRKMNYPEFVPYEHSKRSTTAPSTTSATRDLVEPSDTQQSVDVTKWQLSANRNKRKVPLQHGMETDKQIDNLDEEDDVETAGRNRRKSLSVKKSPNASGTFSPDFKRSRQKSDDQGQYFTESPTNPTPTAKWPIETDSIPPEVSTQAQVSTKFTCYHESISHLITINTIRECRR